MDEKEETRDASRGAIEEAEAIAGGCTERGDAGVPADGAGGGREGGGSGGTADEAIEAEEDVLAEKIRRAKEWQEELEKRAKAAAHA